MNEAKEFVIWKKKNKEEMERRYRKYLDSIAHDKGFELEAMESLEEFIEEEFDIIKEGKTSIWENAL